MSGAVCPDRWMKKAEFVLVRSAWSTLVILYDRDIASARAMTHKPISHLLFQIKKNEELLRTANDRSQPAS